MKVSSASLQDCIGSFKPLGVAVAAALGLLGSGPAAASGTAITTSGGHSTLDPAEGSTLVDSLLTVTSADPIKNAKVSFSGGWQPEDTLSCDQSSGALTCVYDSGTGILSVTGTASAAEWESVLRSVRLTTPSGAGGSRVVTFTLGSAIPFRGPDHEVGHYYEFVPACDGAEGGCGVTWPQAKVQASLRTLFGLQGYLATITSAGENAFIAERLGGDGWIGSSDDYREINAAAATGYLEQSAAEGNWYWVTGPEAGTLISVGNAYEGGPIVAGFGNWADGEPNNYPLPGMDLPEGEYYGQIYASGGGQWNDLGALSQLGYVVEYGGMPGDPVIELSASKSIDVAPAPTLRSASGGSALSPLLLVWMLITGAVRRRRRRLR